MTSSCDRCRHARANHGKWWPDRDTTPCRVRGCVCPAFARYCERYHEFVRYADGSVGCYRCDFELPAEDGDGQANSG